MWTCHSRWPRSGHSDCHCRRSQRHFRTGVLRRTESTGLQQRSRAVHRVWRSGGLFRHPAVVWAAEHSKFSRRITGPAPWNKSRLTRFSWPHFPLLLLSDAHFLGFESLGADPVGTAFPRHRHKPVATLRLIKSVRHTWGGQSDSMFSSYPRLLRKPLSHINEDLPTLTDDLTVALYPCGDASLPLPPLLPTVIYGNGAARMKKKIPGS